MSSGRRPEQGSAGTAADVRDLTRVLARTEQDGADPSVAPRYSEAVRGRLVQLLKQSLAIVTGLDKEEEPLKRKRA